MMSEPRSVLVVDDDAAMREMLSSLLEEAGIGARAAESADVALEALRENDFDAVLSDIRMPDKTGIDLLGELREVRPETPVILMTAFGSLDSAIEALRAGAYDYITKPFKRDAILVAMERAFERRELERENRRLRRAVDHTTSFGDLIGTSPAMREIFALIRKVGNSRASVLLSGESGTGKEVVARTIHFTGARAKRPFVPVNCTAIPEGLLETELFGHVRGAFTGAHTSKRGLFEEADHGTLFLDEIGDMGPSLQGKLLRVLQDNEMRPVGSTKSIKVDVRIIAATNKDLRKEIEEGRFRRDLFYRLNVIPIHIPPLRERPDDIPLLAEVFLRKHSDGDRYNLTPAAVQRLLRCPWEGNARELENLLERAVALAEGPEIQAEDLPLPNETTEPRAQLGEALARSAAQRQLTLREVEDLYIAEILRLAGGNKVHAARILGINRRTLYRRGDRADAGRDSLSEGANA
jgi:DNA-binding NtrC family response regulator